MESGELYGDILPGITESLSLLFKKAHSLQVSLLGLLETIHISNEVSQQNVDDLCFVCQGLFEVCQIVTSLDMKLVVSLWKSISRLASKHKSVVKNTLNIDAMVTYLCIEIINGYKYLLQLAPPTDENTQELSLSQGDAAAFQKSLKLLGYQFRVIMSLLDNFILEVSDCMIQILDMIVHIIRSLPPSIDDIKLSSNCIEDIKRHLVNGIEPLIQLIVSNRSFLTTIMMYVTDNSKTIDCGLTVVQILVKIADCLPKLSDDLMKSWMCYNVEGRNCCLFDLIFLSVEKCFIELSSSLMIQNTLNGRDILLYEYICIHISGLVGSLPAKYFNILETCLIKSLLSGNTYVSCMAEDVWCFIARFGTADLCYQHTKSLTDLCITTGYHYNIVKLATRLMKFLAPDHQNQIIKQYRADSNVRLWCELIIPAVPSIVTMTTWSILYKTMLDDLHNFITKYDRTYSDLYGLLQSLQNLVQLMYNYSSCKESNKGQLWSAVTEKTQMLIDIWNNEWTGETICCKCLSKLTELSGLIVSDLKNEHFIKIFDLLLYEAKGNNITMKLSSCEFLKRCQKVKFSPDAKQPLILKKISVLYNTLLLDPHPLVHHTALQSFTVFAESTPYESLVPECLCENRDLQDKVVTFLSKTPQIGGDFDELKYIRKQYEELRLLHETCEVKQEEVEVVNEAVSKDMLDDIESIEPATKRKKLDEDGMESVISNIEENMKRLELLTSNNTYISDYKHRLTKVNTKLTKLLDSL
ncbi:hypothetical protein ACF0H5_021922 [Mactra antiquata]